YRRSPFESVGAAAILITSKDAIKCRGLNDPRLGEVPGEAHFSDPELFHWLAARLRHASGDAPRCGAPNCLRIAAWTPVYSIGSRVRYARAASTSIAPRPN